MKEMSGVNADSMKKSLIFTFQPDAAGGAEFDGAREESHPITVLGKLRQWKKVVYNVSLMQISTAFPPSQPNREKVAVFSPV